MDKFDEVNFLLQETQCHIVVLCIWQRSIVSAALWDKSKPPANLHELKEEYLEYKTRNILQRSTFRGLVYASQYGGSQLLTIAW